ncbi:hypothetical protein M8J77_010306 [Diaphorina citri]|nr:hypothetical protein M8J77_010306 [Diaphorina citri]
MEKRRRLKRSGLEKIEYAEISKLLRRELKEWLEERKVKRLVDALENGGKLKERPKVRKVITCLNDKQGNEIREKDKILGRVKEFYEELYEGQRSEEDEEEKEETMMIKSSDEWEDILEDEVRKAVAEIKEGKAGGIDRVTVEMIKAGGRQGRALRTRDSNSMDYYRGGDGDPGLKGQGGLYNEMTSGEPGEALFYNSRPPNYKQYSSRQSSWYEDYSSNDTHHNQKTDKRGFSEKDLYDAQSQPKKPKPRGGRRPSLERQTTLFEDDSFLPSFYDSPSQPSGGPQPPHSHGTSPKPLIDTKIGAAHTAGSGYKTKKYQDSRYGSKNEDFQWDSGGPGQGYSSQTYYSSYPSRTASKSFEDEDDEVYYSTQQSYEDENYQPTSMDVTVDYTSTTSSRHKKHNTSSSKESSRYYPQEEEFHYPPPRSKTSTPKCLPEIPRPPSSASSSGHKATHGRKNAQLPRIPQHSSLDYETSEALDPEQRYGSNKYPYSSLDNIKNSAAYLDQHSSKSSSGHPSVSSVKKVKKQLPAVPGMPAGAKTRKFLPSTRGEISTPAKENSFGATGPGGTIGGGPATQVLFSGTGDAGTQPAGLAYPDGAYNKGQFYQEGYTGEAPSGSLYNSTQASTRLDFATHKTDSSYQSNTYQPAGTGQYSANHTGGYNQPYNQTDPYGKTNSQFHNSTSVETYYDSTQSTSIDPYSSTSMDEYNMAYDKTAPGDPYAGHNAMQDPYQQYGETDAYGNSYGYVDEYGNPQPDSGNVYASYNHTVIQHGFLERNQDG